MITAASEHGNDYPIMHNFIVALRTQSMVAHKILMECFGEFWSKVALMLVCPNKYGIIFGILNYPPGLYIDLYY